MPQMMRLSLKLTAVVRTHLWEVAAKLLCAPPHVQDCHQMSQDVPCIYVHYALSPSPWKIEA